MMVGKAESGEYKEIKTNDNGNLEVVMVEGSTGGSAVTINASVHTIGTTATSVSIGKMVTTIDVANYSEDGDVTLTIDNASYVIGSSIATTLTINKTVTNISLVSTEADTKVQLVIKGVE